METTKNLTQRPMAAQVPSQPVIDAFYRLGSRTQAEGPDGEAAAAVAKVIVCHGRARHTGRALTLAGCLDLRGPCGADAGGPWQGFGLDPAPAAATFCRAP